MCSSKLSNKSVGMTDSGESGAVGTARDSLDGMAVGERARIAGIDLVGSQRVRLLEMGLTEGAEIEVVRFAPSGDPIDVKVRGYHLSLRRSEAGGIRVLRL